ncbi:hypothetical protein HWV07_08725 [Natronomonas salina]|uniref:hypothetical protein n=1 Tax=Natronomonas salina TaxID=1710540 RepID=UPI0015B5A2AE|nr:hypothetical protein [Natronomonas salina]QLD89108.1 hypothetical protein HWV07_08725 [Natronomonas salina]
MSEFDTSSREPVALNGTTVELELRPANGTFQIGHCYGSPEDPGHVALLRDGKPIFHNRPINPRSTSITDNGRAVVADWREYGESTGSKVSVYDPDGTVVWQKEYDASSPFVAISAGGEYIAVSPYNGETRVIAVDTEQLITLHSNKLDNREKPVFVGDNPELHLGRNTGDKPAYGITLDDEIVWRSEEFDKHSFIGSLELEAGIEWAETADRLIESYESGDQDMQQRIIETILDTSLANLKSESELEPPHNALRRLYDCVKGDDHKRAVAIPLSDAKYRMARAYKRHKPTQDCLDALGQAITLAEEGLPWYDAKKQLAKCYRFRARLHKQRGNYAAAVDDIERVFNLENEYDVQLATDADRNLRQELVG